MAKQIFLFYGDEDFLIDQRIRLIREKIASPSLHCENIDGDCMTREQIVSALQGQSLLSSEKLVVVRPANLKSEIWGEILFSLKELPPKNYLVLVADEVSPQSKIFKFIEANGEVEIFKSFAPWEQDQVIAWIGREVRARGKGIGREAAERLQEISGSGLRKLSSEIEKLITYIGEKKEIALEDVLALASPGEKDAFSVSDALAEKNLGRALGNLRLLTKNRVDPFKLLSLLASQYRAMLFMKHESNPQKGAQQLGASPYYLKKCQEKGRKFSEEELKKDLSLLLQADLDIKSGKEQLTVLELLLASLCGK